MTQTLGQALVVENAGGAGSTVWLGPRCSRRSRRLHASGQSCRPGARSGALYRKLSYDPDADFDGIGRITDVPMTIVARADFEPTEIAGYIDYVKKNGERSSTGTPVTALPRTSAACSSWTPSTRR